jgi:hypothetical protein
MCRGQQIDGEWNGVVKVPNLDLKMNLYISHDANGYTTKWDSPDQGSYGKVSTKTTYSYPDLYFAYEPADFDVQLKVDPKFSKLTGTMNQRGQTYTVELSRKVPEQKTGTTGEKK